MAVNVKRKRKTRKRRRRPDDRDETRQASAKSELASLQQQIGNRAVQRMLAQRKQSLLAKARQQHIRQQETESEPQEPAEAVKFPSGASWVDRFPVSDDPHHLDSNFRSFWTSFRSVVETAGANVEILATRKPLERAYLMHWAWRIAKENYDPRRVPYMEGVNIRWWHGDIKTSQAAAWEMVHGYEIGDKEEPPPLASPYTEGKVIATRITWSGDLTIYRDQPTEQIITEGPHDATNPELIELAETYRLVHLLTVEDSDEVHWTTEE